MGGKHVQGEPEPRRVMRYIDRVPGFLSGGGTCGCLALNDARARRSAESEGSLGIYQPAFCVRWRLQYRVACRKVDIEDANDLGIHPFSGAESLAMG